MKHSRMLLLVASLLCISLVPLTVQAEMIQHWRIDAGSVAWFSTTDHAIRGMCYNPVTDHVLVVSRTGGNSIRVLNAADGTELGTMDVTGMTGGTFVMNKIRVVDLGGGAYSVFVANLTLNTKTDSVRIYRWHGTGGASETTLGAPTLIYSNRASDGTPDPSPIGPVMPETGTLNFRLGDIMDAVNSGNNVQLYFPRALNPAATPMNTILRFNYVAGATEIASIDTITLDIPVADSGTTPYATSLDGYNGNIYFSANNVQNFARYDNTGGSRTVIPSNNTVVNIGANCTHTRFGTIGGKNYIAYVDTDHVGSGANGYRRIAVAEIPASGPAFAAEVDYSPHVGEGGNANGNAAGDADFDTLRGRILGLVTNNFIGSFSLDNATGTKKWDGGAGTSSWADAANWDPDGVPGMGHDVVLDNALVAGNYTVRIDTNSRTFGCRTLTIGDAVTANEIILEVTSDARIALHIVGTQDAQDDFVIEEGGRFVNLSAAAGGNIIDNRNPGATTRVKDGGSFVHGCARSFGTPFPTDAAANHGATTFESGSTLEFSLSAGTAVALSNRTYGNLRLTATAAKTYTGSGGFPLLIQNDLYIGPDVTFNPSMTGLFTIQGNVISEGNGGALSSTAAGGVIFDGATSIGGSGTPVTLPGGFTVTDGSSLTLDQPLTVPAARTGAVVGTLAVNDALTVEGTLNLGVNDVTGTGSVAIASGAALITQHEDGLDGIQTSGTNTFSTGANYTFSGAAAQETGAALPAEVNNLTIDNPAGVTLSGSVAATGQLSLATGELITAGNTLTAMDGAAAVVSTGGFVNGTLTRMLDAAVLGARRFDIGTAGNYVPVTVDITTAGTGTGTLAVSSTDGDHPGLPGNDAFALNRYWTITESGISGFVADVTFAYQASDIGTANQEDFIAARYLSGQDWQEFGSGATVIDSINHTAAVSGVSMFSDWTLYEEFTAVSGWLEY